MKPALSTLAVLLVALAGCTASRPPGADRDAHGCIPSAGYVWSDADGACVRPWERKAP